jgi:hypothetical protein
MNLYKTKNILGKDIYIIEAHHFALFPWAHVRRGLDSAPTLITLDHHTDTHKAFCSYRARTAKYNFDAAEAMLPSLVASIDWSTEERLQHTVNLLRHDEHIHAAFLSNIISVAFSINLSDQLPSIEEDAYQNWNSRRFEFLLEGKGYLEPAALPLPPYTYTSREDGMFTISTICAIGCKKMPHDDECEIVRHNQVLESSYLNHELVTANAMAKSIEMASAEEKPYILDIDLDYFHSERSINPVDTETFYRLIRNAIAITVARESECVHELRHVGSNITADSLLRRLSEHIEAALE